MSETEHTHDAEAGVTFNAKKGLLVPPATARFIGLQVADVGERKIASASRFSAQVYRAAGEILKRRGKYFGVADEGDLW
jgi:hypothetical protein